MFGYVTPLIPELKVKEHNLYKSIYCGLCASMGKNVCRESRMTLSYDMVFLAVTRLALTGEEFDITSKRCFVHPAKKRPVMRENESLAYCARASALLSYHKLKDNISDSRGIKKIAYLVALPFEKRMRRRAGLRELDARIESLLRELSEKERARSDSLDECAELFGNLLADIFEFGLESAQKRIAHEIGFHTGKWIYMADAADDFEKDLSSGEFNPLISSGAKSKEEIKDRLSAAMLTELSLVGAALNLVTDCDAALKSIAENIVFLGMPAVSERVLQKSETKSKGKGQINV